MGKEQFTTAEVEQLQLGIRPVEKWSDAVATGLAANVFNAAGGASILDSLHRGDIPAALLLSVFYGLGGYFPLVDRVSNSDRRADALAKVTSNEPKPAESLAITPEQYRALDVPSSHQTLSEVNRVRLMSLFMGIGAYTLISEISQGNVAATVLAAGLTAYSAWETLQIGLKSDRRREVLRNVFRGYKFDS